MATNASVAETIAGIVDRARSVASCPCDCERGTAARSDRPARPCVVLRSRRALRHILWSPGELGLAHAYVTGDLDVEGDVEDGFHLVSGRSRAAPRRAGDVRRAGRSRRARSPRSVSVRSACGPRARLPKRGRSDGSTAADRDRAAIAHHYDLSNDFYALILDESMAYSCAYWPSDTPGLTLADAQRAKLDLVCRKLGVEPGMRLLDVGCGWGSLSIHAAREYGAQVTGVTLSQQQLDFVRKRVADNGLHDQVDVRLQDYRDLDDGPYDAIASIEMGEHVGDENYPMFAETLAHLLRPEGRVLVQQMSRRGATHRAAGRSSRRTSRPTCTCGRSARPSPSSRTPGSRSVTCEALREHYVRTARAWLATLEARWDEIVDLVGVEMARVWRLYMVGGIVAFDEGRMGVDQILAVKAAPDGRSGMLPTRSAWT